MTPGIIPSSTHRRIAFIDNLRAFIFILLAFDHVIHAYALYFGRFHFFKDFDRSVIADMFYLFDNSIIMPLLFFIFGLFILPALDQKGLKRYIKNRFLKLGIPYIIGIPFIVPFLVFPRYCFDENPACNFGDFWLNVYFSEKIQGGGPFWVLFCLGLYSLILITVVKLVPFIRVLLKQLMHTMLRYPFLSIILFILVSMTILTLSDYRWGAPWWIGLEPFKHYDDQPIMQAINKIIHLFHLQGARFITHALYFVLGAMISLTDQSTQQNLWLSLSQRWQTWLSGMIIVGVAYIGFTLVFVNDGAYSPEIYRYFYQGGKWLNALPIIEQYGWAVTTRTCLHGVFIFFQATTFISLFHRHVNYTRAFWCKLSRCTYGIFLLHEVPVIWLQYKLNNVDLPILVKVISIFTIGVGGTWLCVDKLLKIPGVKKII